MNNAEQLLAGTPPNRTFSTWSPEGWRHWQTGELYQDYLDREAKQNIVAVPQARVETPLARVLVGDRQIIVPSIPASPAPIIKAGIETSIEEKKIAGIGLGTLVIGGLALWLLLKR